MTPEYWLSTSYHEFPRLGISREPQIQGIVFIIRSKHHFLPITFILLYPLLCHPVRGSHSVHIRAMS